MARSVPVLDPKVRLVGATPEKLAKALFKKMGPLPPRVGKSVRAGEVAVEKVATDKAGNPVPHLRKGS